MRLNSIRPALTWLLFVLLALGGAAPARAQQQTLTATASVGGASGQKATAPLTVVIRSYATEEQRSALLAAVKEGGSPAARKLLSAWDDAGMLQLGTKAIPVKYAFTHKGTGGQLITVVTAQPIAFVLEGQPDMPDKAGYELGLVLLDLTASSGEMVPAAKVRIDEQGAIVTADHSAQTVRLSAVARK
jgi:hypothetical protein